MTSPDRYQWRARQGRARRLGASRQGRSGWCRTFARRPSLGRSLDGQDAGCLLRPSLPEGDGRGRRYTGPDRGCGLLRQPYCRWQRRLRLVDGTLLAMNVGVYDAIPEDPAKSSPDGSLQA